MSAWQSSNSIVQLVQTHSPHMSPGSTIIRHCASGSPVSPVLVVPGSPVVAVTSVVEGSAPVVEVSPVVGGSVVAGSVVEVPPDSVAPVVVVVGSVVGTSPEVEAAPPVLPPELLEAPSVVPSVGVPQATVTSIGSAAVREKMKLRVMFCMARRYMLGRSRPNRGRIAGFVGRARSRESNGDRGGAGGDAAMFRRRS